MDEKILHSCPRCQIGYLQRGQATFTTIYQGELLSIPDLTAWTCDICQYHEFDARALQEVELLTDILLSGTDAPRSTPRSTASEPFEASKSQRLKP